MEKKQQIPPQVLAEGNDPIQEALLQMEEAERKIMSNCQEIFGLQEENAALGSRVEMLRERIRRIGSQSDREEQHTSTHALKRERQEENLQDDNCSESQLYTKKIKMEVTSPLKSDQPTEQQSTAPYLPILLNTHTFKEEAHGPLRAGVKMKPKGPTEEMSMLPPGSSKRAGEHSDYMAASAMVCSGTSSFASKPSGSHVPLDTLDQEQRKRRAHKLALLNALNKELFPEDYVACKSGNPVPGKRLQNRPADMSFRQLTQEPMAAQTPTQQQDTPAMVLKSNTSGMRAIHEHSGPVIPEEEPQDRPTTHPHSLQLLIQALKAPQTPTKQQEVLAILKANPSLMAAFIKQRAQQQQQQQHQEKQQQQGMTKQEVDANKTNQPPF